MDNIADQDELFYTAKNFKKLKFSNTAYKENMTKDNFENQEEIKNLKKEYDKIKHEVLEMRRKTLYNAGSRVKSASSNQENQNSELHLLRSKLDYVRNEKIKSREEWKRLDERLKELKSESKYLNDDNNPYMRKIKLLENKLDKAMIKYNEAMSIRRTYEQILARLKEERAGYDNQIMAIQKSLKAKEHDCEEFKALLQDATQARVYSQLLLKNAELSREAFEQHFEQLIKAHEKETKNDLKTEKVDESKKKIEKIDVQKTFSDESRDVRNSQNKELEIEVQKYEQADKMVRETTGADDINEICQKFSNLRETKDKLKKERKDLEKMFESLTKKKDELVFELNNLKYQGQDEITRKEIEDNEKTAERTLKNCEEARSKLKKSENMMVEIRAALNMIASILKSKIFEDIFNDDNNFSERDLAYKQAYLELQSTNDKDLRLLLGKIIDVAEYLYQKYTTSKENYPEYDENEQKLNRKEEDDIDNIYMSQKIDTNQNSEWGPDDDIESGLNHKDHGISKNDFANYNSNRPYTCDVRRTKLNRLILKAKNKKK